MSEYPASENATTIINTVASEVGLTPVADPYSSSDKNFVQMTYLLNTAGRELSRMYNWQFILEDGSITILSTDGGQYDVPTDFLSLIPETMWDHTDQQRVVGPLTPREWQALEACDTASEALLYVRMFQGQFSFYPHDPVGSDKTIKYQYKSAYWAVADDDTTYKKTLMVGTDKPLFDSLLVSRYLKFKWLSAKNLDSADAHDDFVEIYNILTGEDVPGIVLNASGVATFPLLDNYNVRETGYGST